MAKSKQQIIEELRKEIKHLTAELKTKKEFVCILCGEVDPSFVVECKKCRDKEIDRLTAELKAKDKKIEKLEMALERIDTWSKAYPLDIFLKPDLKKAHKVLKAAGMTLDAISADAMRHVLDGIKDIVGEALKGINDGEDGL
jgi:uncharacterized small protein (DUF1192 family)